MKQHEELTKKIVGLRRGIQFDFVKLSKKNDIKNRANEGTSDMISSSSLSYDSEVSSSVKSKPKLEKVPM